MGLWNYGCLYVQISFNLRLYILLLHVFLPAPSLPIFLVFFNRITERGRETTNFMMPLCLRFVTFLAWDWEGLNVLKSDTSWPYRICNNVENLTSCSCFHLIEIWHLERDNHHWTFWLSAIEILDIEIWNIR